MPCKLLLVDDSVTIRRVVELTFAGEDVSVVAVGDGREAMERIVAERPDIVLADVGPGEPDGYEVARFVKQHPALSHVPVVLLTGACQPVERARAAECGCDGVLAKPFDLQGMVGVVRGLLHRPAVEAAGGTATQVHPEEASGAPAVTAAATPAGGNGDAPDAATLIDWWASLLQEPAPQEPADVLPAVPVTIAPNAPDPAPQPAVSLDDYFDLLDDLLAEPGQTCATAPLPPFRFS
jgi:CheY-like chemotaxis protein